MANINPNAESNLSRNEEVQNVTDGGNQPNQRFHNAKAAKNVYKELIEAGDILAIERALIQAQLDGEPPVRRSEKRRMGLAWESNVNFRENFSTTRSNVSSIWNMFNSTEYFFDMDIKDQKDIDPQLQSFEFGEIISEEATRAIKSWPSYNYVLKFKIQEMAKFGNGPSMWLDEWDYRSKEIRNGNFMVPQQTSSNFDDLDVCGIRSELSPHEVFEILEDEELAKDDGWDVMYLKRVMVKKYKGQLKGNSDDYITTEFESIRHQIKNKDSSMNNEQFKNLEIGIMMCRGKEGMIEQYIIVEDDEEDLFLFKDLERYESYHKVLNWFMQDIGDGYYKSVRGLSYELYPTSDISNRVMNHILTGALMAGGITLKGNSGKDSRIAPLMKKGPVTVINDNYEAVQQNVFPQINQLVEARNIVNNIQESNAGVFRNKDRNADGQARSATEVQLDANNQARFENDQAAWYYIQWEMWIVETLRRLMNKEYPKDHQGYSDHAEFIKRCKDRGVPSKLLDFDKWNITATRAIGLGSTSTQMQLTSATLNIATMFDEQGRLNAIRDWLGVRYGYKHTNRYSPRKSRNDIQTSDHADAQVENHIFAMGKEVIIEPGVDQFHVIHIKQHFPAAADIAGRYQQEPESINIQVDTITLKNLIVHIADHVDLLAQDPTRRGLVEEFSQIIQSLSAVFQKMQSDLERLMQQRQRQLEEQQKMLQEAAQNKEMLELQAKREEIAKDERIEQEKADSLDRNRTAKTVNDIQNANEKAQADMDRKDRESEREQDRLDRESESKNNRTENTKEDEE